MRKERESVCEREEEGNWTGLEGRERQIRLGQGERKRVLKTKVLLFCLQTQTETTKNQCNGMNARQTEQHLLI